MDENLRALAYNIAKQRVADKIAAAGGGTLTSRVREGGFCATQAFYLQLP